MANIRKTMKTTLFTIVFSLSIFLGAYAQVPPMGFATSYGGTGSDASWSVAVDALGNTYTGGYFNGTTTVGQSNLTSTGDNDLLVVKHDANGNAQWAVNFGWVLQDMAFTIAADDAGNSYLAARWFYQITVDGTVYNAINDGKDIGVFKLDTDGNLVWFATFGGSGTDTPNDIAVDANGNVFVTGQFVNDFTFNGNTVNSNGSDDVFVAKLNANGTPAWLSTFGSTFGDIGRGIAIDGNGNCYVTGNARGNSVIGTVNLNAPGNNYDVFLIKYNNAGVAQWAHSIGGANSDYAYGLSADATGNTYMAGFFTNSITIGSTDLTANGTLYTDAFVAKFNNTGNAQWAKKIGAEGSDGAYGVSNDADGNTYVVGDFNSNISIGGTGLFSAGSSDAFIAKLDGSGNFLWADRIGGTGIDHGYGVAVHQNGNCFVTGFYSEEMTVGTTTLANAGDFDVYLVRYGDEIITSINQLIEPVSNSKEIGRFNILGQPVQENHPYLQIILFEDGTRQKVMPLRL